MWKICGDLKMVRILLRLQGGYEDGMSSSKISKSSNGSSRSSKNYFQPLQMFSDDADIDLNSDDMIKTEKVSIPPIKVLTQNSANIHNLFLNENINIKFKANRFNAEIDSCSDMVREAAQS